MRWPPRSALSMNHVQYAAGFVTVYRQIMDAAWVHQRRRIMYQPPTQATRAHWDSLASGYDDLKQRNDAYYGALKACFDRAVPPVMRGSILDVGCGTGQVLAMLRPGRGVGI